MTALHTIAIPHDDILKGNLIMDVFAAEIILLTRFHVLWHRNFGKVLYRVAQAISKTLSLESEEMKPLDGFLAGRDRVQDEVEKAGRQERRL